MVLSWGKGPSDEKRQKVAPKPKEPKSETEAYASLKLIREAAKRIAPFAKVTPVHTCSSIDDMMSDKIDGATIELFFKCETFQKGGAFKFRGAMNSILQLSKAELKAGVVTHSSGNHAGALALAAKTKGIPSYIVVPEGAGSADALRTLAPKLHTDFVLIAGDVITDVDFARLADLHRLHGAAVTALLEIEESRKQEFGVWARLRCVGRVKLADVDQTDFGYARAKVSLVTDSAPDDNAVDEAKLSACLEAHAACNELTRKLKGLSSDEADGALSVTSDTFARA